jgi:hypothetical protein
MLWAQPDHLSFAVLEANDVGSALQYVKALVPDCWTFDVLPVWNLPSQWLLVQQIRHLPSTASAAAAETEPEQAIAPSGGVVDHPEPASDEVPPADDSPTIPPVATEPSSQTPGGHSPEGASHAGALEPPAYVESPGTITRLVIALDTPLGEEVVVPTGAQAEPTPEPSPDPDLAGTLTNNRDQPAQEDGSSLRCVLVATAGATRGRTFSIPMAGATIGRLPENVVSLPDERLSREHARLEFREGHFWLRDLGSTNGTTLNGNLVSNPVIVSNGDTIELGSNTLVVTIQAPS